MQCQLYAKCAMEKQNWDLIHLKWGETEWLDQGRIN